MTYKIKTAFEAWGTLSCKSSPTAFLGSFDPVNLTAARTYTLPDLNTSLIGLNSPLAGWVAGSGSIAAADTLLVALGKVVDLGSTQTISGAKTFSSALISTVATGTAPFTVTSTTPVANLSIGGSAASATNATNSTNVGITEDTTTAVAVYPTWVTANTGNLPQKTTSTRLSFIPSTGVLSATQFSGSGAGLSANTIPKASLVNMTGAAILGAAAAGAVVELTTIPATVLGNSTVYIGTTAVALNRASAALALTGITSIDGSAATLTTARTINGTSFNGSANITITASTTNTLMIGNGLSGVSFNGSAAVTIAVSAPDTQTAATYYPVFATSQGTAVVLGTDVSYTFNPSTGVLTATQFNGSGAGLTATTVPVGSLNATGTPSGTTYLRGDGTWATPSGSVSTTDDATTSATYYPVWTTAVNGTTLKTSSTKLSFNPSTGQLVSTSGRFGSGTAVGFPYLAVCTPNGTASSIFFVQNGVGSGHVGLRVGDSSLYVVNSYATGAITDTPAIKLGTDGLTTVTSLAITGAAGIAGSLFFGASGGLTVWSKTGTVNDFSLINPAGSAHIMDVPTGTLNVTFAGSITAVSKSFLINHPTREGKKLQYGSLEGPENGVYVRGRLIGTDLIELPEYWTVLVDPETITVQLTSIGKRQSLYVKRSEDNKVWVGGSKSIDCYYIVYAERRDIAKLVVEF